MTIVKYQVNKQQRHLRDSCNWQKTQHRIINLTDIHTKFTGSKRFKQDKNIKFNNFENYKSLQIIHVKTH